MRLEDIDMIMLITVSECSYEAMVKGLLNEQQELVEFLTVDFRNLFLPSVLKFTYVLLSSIMASTANFS